MMLARYALAHRIAEHAAHHAFERVLHEEIIADQVGRHVARVSAARCAKAEASVAGRLQTPPYAAKRKGLISEAYAALRSDGNRSIVVIGNCAMVRYRWYHTGR